MADFSGLLRRAKEAFVGSDPRSKIAEMNPEEAKAYKQEITTQLMNEPTEGALTMRLRGFGVDFWDEDERLDIIQQWRKKKAKEAAKVDMESRVEADKQELFAQQADAEEKQAAQQQQMAAAAAQGYPQGSPGFAQMLQQQGPQSQPGTSPGISDLIRRFV